MTKITHQDTQAKAVMLVLYAGILNTLTEPTMADRKLQENICGALHSYFLLECYLMGTSRKTFFVGFVAAAIVTSFPIG